MSRFQLEVCVDSVESAVNAFHGGADRLELCSNLVIGGTTPSASLFRLIQQACDMKINVLIRPRFGDFCYTDYEFAQMLEDVKIFKALGANGVVIGILTPEGKLDVPRMKELVKAAEGIDVTLHRAFDMCDDYQEALETAYQLGVHTILTSGGKNNAIDGVEVLEQLVASKKVDILIGSGVKLDTISDIYEKTKAMNYHMSGKEVLESEMVYRNKDVYMGLDGISEYSIFRTNEAHIREVMNLLESMGDS